MTIVRFDNYQIEIPDALIAPIETLATILGSDEVDHELEIVHIDNGQKLLETCNHHVIAAIGKCFAHDIKLREVLSAWETLGYYSKLEAIFEAARSTEPIDLFKYSVNQDV